MSGCLVYKIVDGAVVSDTVEGHDVANMLSSGWFGSIEQAKAFSDADTNETGKLSDAEIKEAAKKAGIKIGRKKIETLRAEMGL